jgi:hypothetical protein
MKSIDILEAEFSSIKPNASIVLLGKRRTGKTTWAKVILQTLDKSIHRFVAFCGNKDNECEWKRILPPLFVMRKNIESLTKLRDYQDRKVSEFTSNDLEVPVKYRVCVILDDCGSDRKFMHSNIIKDILSNGRHYGMTLVILCQYLNQLHPENRDQLDYLGILYTSNHKNIKKIHEEYVNMTDIRTFKFVVNACTVDRGCCWVDNTTTPSTIDECVFYKRIHTLPSASIGHAYMYEFSRTHLLDEKELTTKQQNNEVTHNLSDSNSDSMDEDVLKADILNPSRVYSDKHGDVRICKIVNKQKIE